MTSAKSAKQALQQLADPEKAKHSAAYFKTGKGEYGEGDVFIGVRVPQIRAVAKDFYQLSLDDLQILLHSTVHEERFLALVILIHQYQKRKEAAKSIYSFYCSNFHKINNWDLVDLSARDISGAYLFSQANRMEVLTNWAKSEHLWTRRISVLSTFYFIRHNDYQPTIKLAEMLLGDSHDLMHKAIGWMLREVGKKDVSVLRTFLKKHATQMPRTMLRYAIEKLDIEERRYFLDM